MTRRCLMIQCFALGGILMLLLIKFAVGFPFSSEIGKCAIYITALFVLAGMVADEWWGRRIMRLRPEVTRIKDATEATTYLYRVFSVLPVLAVALLIVALALMAFFHMKPSQEPIQRMFTNWPLYVLIGSWLVHTAFFLYDSITLQLWIRSEAAEKPATV